MNYISDGLYDTFSNYMAALQVHTGEKQYKSAESLENGRMSKEIELHTDLWMTCTCQVECIETLIHKCSLKRLAMLSNELTFRKLFPMSDQVRSWLIVVTQLKRSLSNGSLTRWAMCWHQVSTFFEQLSSKLMWCDSAFNTSIQIKSFIPFLNYNLFISTFININPMKEENKVSHNRKYLSINIKWKVPPGWKTPLIRITFFKIFLSATFFVYVGLKNNYSYRRSFFILIGEVFVQNDRKKYSYRRLYSYRRFWGKYSYWRSFYKGFIKKWVWVLRLYSYWRLYSYRRYS